MNLPILFEDGSFLVVNKPPGVVVNRAESVKGETVQDWLEKKRKAQSAKCKVEDKDFYDRAGIVHRIDKETSGVLLIAKTPQAFHELQRQFKERRVKKTYLALVHGRLTPQEGKIRAPIGRLPWNRERFGIVPGGREAVTKFIIQNSKLKINDEDVTLVELYPETGRTHQIRVHLQYINHPIVGDFLYCGRKTAREDRRHVARTMLHAAKISFTHPATGLRVAFEAPIPDDMKSIIHG
jgi:23S rRNA pseudouridine1911/1915/1917 synthase